MKIGAQEFDRTDHTYVMGILNMTPDSFSDGGRYNAVDRALFRVGEMMDEGADMIDVGGESTRPGHVPVSDEEELERIIPIVDKIKCEYNIPVSLDTYKPVVAEAGIAAGADMINDIWGLQYDPAMGRIVASSGVAYCLMHNRRNPNGFLTISNLLGQMQDDLRRALGCGIAKGRIMLDPGVGFAKNQEENLMVLANMGRLKELGCPVLLGASRKSVIDYVLHLPVNRRLEGSLATTAAAVAQGISFVRVHDVGQHVRFIAMAEAIRERKEEWLL